MSTNYLIMAIIICIFDVVVLFFNYTKLKFHTPTSIAHLIVGILLAAVLIVLLFRAGSADFGKNIVIVAIAMTFLTWGLLRKGIGQQYVFNSLSMNGLTDWHNVRTVETVQNGPLVKFTAIDFMKRPHVIHLQGDAAEIKAFAEERIQANKNEA